MTQGLRLHQARDVSLELIVVINSSQRELASPFRCWMSPIVHVLRLPGKTLVHTAQRDPRPLRAAQDAPLQRRWSTRFQCPTLGRPFQTHRDRERGEGGNGGEGRETETKCAKAKQEMILGCVS